MERAKQQRRQGQLTAAGARSSWLLGLLQRGLLRANYIVNDHSRSVLILSVFAFKVDNSLLLGNNCCCSHITSTQAATCAWCQHARAL